MPKERPIRGVAGGLLRAAVCSLLRCNAPLWQAATPASVGRTQWFWLGSRQKQMVLGAKGYLKDKRTLSIYPQVE